MDRALEILRHPLVFPLAAALLAGGIAYVLSRWWVAACRVLALASAGVMIAWGVRIAQLGPDATLSWRWVELAASLHLTLDLAYSLLGMVVLFGSAGFALLITVYSFRAMAGEYWEGKFYAYLIWALAGAAVVALADNLLVLLVGWELVTLMLFLMTNQGGPEARAGAAKAYGMLGFADACLLLAIAILAGQPGGSDNWSLSRGPAAVASAGPVGYLLYALILIAALAKAGAIPLHTWIPAIAAEAPTALMAYLPAAVDKLLGIYLLAVLSFRIYAPDWTLQVVLMLIGAVTILAAVLMAMMQHNLKKLLSFHAVSQVGYMVLGLGTGTALGVIGGLFHMINHAIYKSNLFLMSGAVSRASGTDEIEDMGGLARRLPVTFACGLVAAAAISGVPPFNGFVSKWLIYQGTLEVGHHGLAVGLLTVAVFGSALTLASFVKVIYSAFLSPAPRPAAASAGRAGESFFLVVPMVVLAAACVVLGLWPQIVIGPLLKPAVPAGLAGSLDVPDVWGAIQTGGPGLWNPTQATGLIVLGIVLGLALRWVATRGGKVRVVRPFLGGEVPPAGDDRFRVPGTHFYETIARLPILRALLKHGQRGAMDPYHWASRYGHTVIDVLRAGHSGLISLYVAWVVVGLSATVVYLLIALR